MSTPSLVLIETIWKLGDTPPTAAGLALGFGAFWALTACLGAVIGRVVASQEKAGPG